MIAPPLRSRLADDALPDEALLHGAREAVAEMRDRSRLAERLEPYRDLLWDGAARAVPVLHLDDFSALPFLDNIHGVELYQHRARLRAGDGDLFAAVAPPSAGYETYCRERLRLGSPECLVAEPLRGPLGIAAACSRGRAFERLVARAREAGGLDLHPFMGIERVWKLARWLATASGAAVRVVAPPPPVTWVANDKAAFSEVVRRVLGEGWLVEGASAAEPAAMADRLLQLARRHPRVALKRLRCVSGMGNATFDAADLLAGDAERVRQEVDGFLAFTGWDGREEVQVVAWEETEHSPSTQLWIPPAGTGPPRLDAICEQILEGEQKVFAGSRPSTLPAAVNRTLAAAALRVAAGLQALGYAGRCSFDHLLLGDPAGEFAVRFVECNGRWGGSSLPMHLVDRLAAGSRPPYRAQQLVHPDLVGATFEEVLERTGDDLYDPARASGSYIFFNVGPLALHGKLDVIALGATQEEADEAMLERLPRRLGLA